MGEEGRGGKEGNKEEAKGKEDKTYTSFPIPVLFRKKRTESLGRWWIWRQPYVCNTVGYDLVIGSLSEKKNELEFPWDAPCKDRTCDLRITQSQD